MDIDFKQLYAIKWKDSAGQSCEIAISGRTSSSAVVITELQPSANPLEIAGDPNEDPMTPFRKSTAKIGIIVAGALPFSIDNATQWYVVFSRGIASIWSGWLKPEALSQQLSNKLREIILTAEDGVGVMSSLKYKPADLTSKTLREVIVDCLLPIARWNTPIKYPHDWIIPGNALSYTALQLGISPTNFITKSDADNLLEGDDQYDRATALEVLESVCTFFGWTLRAEGMGFIFEAIGCNEYEEVTLGALNDNSGLITMSKITDTSIENVIWGGVNHSTSVLPGANGVRVRCDLKDSDREFPSLETSKADYISSVTAVRCYESDRRFNLVTVKAYKGGNCHAVTKQYNDSGGTLTALEAFPAIATNNTLEFAFNTYNQKGISAGALLDNKNNALDIERYPGGYYLAADIHNIDEDENFYGNVKVGSIEPKNFNFNDILYVQYRKIASGTTTPGENPRSTIPPIESEVIRLKGEGDVAIADGWLSISGDVIPNYFTAEFRDAPGSEDYLTLTMKLRVGNKWWHAVDTRSFTPSGDRFKPALGTWEDTEASFVVSCLRDLRGKYERETASHYELTNSNVRLWDNNGAEKSGYMIPVNSSLCGELELIICFGRSSFFDYAITNFEISHVDRVLDPIGLDKLKSTNVYYKALPGTFDDDLREIKLNICTANKNKASHSVITVGTELLTQLSSLSSNTTSRPELILLSRYASWLTKSRRVIEIEVENSQAYAAPASILYGGKRWQIIARTVNYANGRAKLTLMENLSGLSDTNYGQTGTDIPDPEDIVIPDTRPGDIIPIPLIP